VKTTFFIIRYENIISLIQGINIRKTFLLLNSDTMKIIFSLIGSLETDSPLFEEFKRYEHMMEEVKFEPDNISYDEKNRNFMEKSRFSFLINGDVDYGEAADYVASLQAQPKDTATLSDENVSSYGDWATSAYTMAPFDMLDYFVLRSWHDSLAPYRPNVNHRPVKYTNITTSGNNVGPSMLDVAKGEAKGEENRDFHKTNLGMMFYEVVCCDECKTISDVNNCTLGFPLTTMGRITFQGQTGFGVLNNMHGKLITRDGLQKAADYFNCDLKVQNDPPTASEVAAFLSVLQGTHCRTVPQLNEFLTERNIPLRIPQDVSFTRAKKIMAYHYQRNGSLFIAAWEGSHRLYLEVAMAQDMPLSGNIPLEPKFYIPRTTNDSTWIYGAKTIPEDSPLLQDAMIQLLVPQKDVNARDYIAATRQAGEERTEAAIHVIEQNCSAAFIKCSEALTEATLKSRSDIKLLDNNRPFLLREWGKKHDYITFRSHVFRIYWDIFVNDMYVKDRLKTYAENKKSLALPAVKLANAVPDSDRQSDVHYRLQVIKNELIDTFYDLNKKRTHMKPEMQHDDSEDRRMNCPDWFLTYLQLLTYGCITTEAMDVFETYFGGPSFVVSQSKEEGANFMLTDEFLCAIVKTTNDVVRLLVEFYAPKDEAEQKHPKYEDGLNYPKAKAKLRMLLTHNIMLDIMSAVNRFGPNPVVPEMQYVNWAMR